MSTNKHVEANGDITYNVTPADRIIERSRGCWNCTHRMEQSAAVKKWEGNRIAELQKALVRFIEFGETDQKGNDIKSVVNSMDHAVASGAFGLCRREKGPAPGAFIVANFLCEDGWTGALGASVATAGFKLDKTSLELQDEKK